MNNFLGATEKQCSKDLVRRSATCLALSQHVFLSKWRPKVIGGHASGYPSLISYLLHNLLLQQSNQSIINRSSLRLIVLSASLQEVLELLQNRNWISRSMSTCAYRSVLLHCLSVRGIDLSNRRGIITYHYVRVVGERSSLGRVGTLYYSTPRRGPTIQ